MRPHDDYHLNRPELTEVDSEGFAIQLGDAPAARKAIDELLKSPQLPVVTVADAVARIRRGESRRPRQMIITGAPPRREIGFGIAVLISAYLRVRLVTRLDTASATATSQNLSSFLYRSGPFAVAQLISSAAVLPWQRLAASLVVRLPGARRSPDDGTLRRLLYLRPHAGAPSSVGGSVTHSHEVIRSLRKLGVDVDAVTNDSSIAATAAAESDPACVWKTSRQPDVLNAIPASAAVGGDLALALNNLARAREADVIYQRHARFSLAGPLLALLARRPLFLEYNGSEAYFGTHWQRTPLMRLLGVCEDAALIAASRVIVVSEVLRQSLIARGVAPTRIVLNPNGVDASRFATGGGAEIRRELRFDDSAIVAGFVGSFGPWHGAPVLARAFASVAAQVPHLRLLLVGDGQELGPTLQIVREAGLEGRTTVVGQVPPPAVPAYLDACDVLVAPHVPLPDGADFFGSPTKLFEYMAAGKAIVASRLGQIGEVLEPGKTAILVTPGDADDLAAGLKRLAGDSNLRSELGRNVRRTAVTRHSWELNASRVVEAYHSLVEESRSDLSNGQTRE
jgi:glycosyltransferase involved in cell wall biosynthesis